MVEVVFAEQVVEELQACGGEFHWGAGAGNHRGHQLLPGQVKIVTVTEPETVKQLAGSLSLSAFYSLPQYCPGSLVTSSLYEQTVQCEEPLAGQTILLDSLGRIFDDDSFQAVQSAGLQVHLETSLLEPGKLVV